MVSNALISAGFAIATILQRRRRRCMMVIFLRTMWMRLKTKTPQKKKTSVDLKFLVETIIKLSFLNVNLVLRQINVLELLPFFKYFVSIFALLTLTEAFED